MSKRTEIRITGFGGQGVVLAGHIIGHASAVNSGMHATMIQSFGPEARGSAWVLVHFLHAMEVDFDDVLRKKNALVSFRQIIRELEATQTPLHSPMVLNGSQFGLFANHSLIMANYISRANAAIIDLRKLLQEG